MAMLKNKHITISFMLVCLILVSPMAKAQNLGGLIGGIGGLLGGGGGGCGGGGGSGGLLGGLGGGSGGLLGGLGGLGGLLNLASIQGVLYCSFNGGLSLNPSSTPAFANAGVQLQCGRLNTVVSTTTTNAAGIFSLPTNTIQMLLSTLVSDCKIVVMTPLASCNATLPSVGSLVSPLSVMGSTVNGLLTVINLGPSGFTLVN